MQLPRRRGFDLGAAFLAIVVSRAWAGIKLETLQFPLPRLFRLGFRRSQSWRGELLP